MRRYKKSKFKNNNYKKTFICLILLAIILSNSYLLARYSSSINRSSSKGVAKFDVSLDTSDNISDSLSLVSGVTTANYTLKVINSSEVSSGYSIVLSNVPAGLEVMLDNSGTYSTPTNNQIVFSGNNCTNCSFTINDIGSTHTHILTFNDPSNTSNNGAYQINIDVNVEQID